MLAICQEPNSTLSRTGVVGLSVAALAWGIVLLRQGSRGIGGVGLVCGTAPLLALGTGHLPMSFHGFGAFVLAQGVWYLVMASVMVRRV